MFCTAVTLFFILWYHAESLHSSHEVKIMSVLRASYTSFTLWNLLFCDIRNYHTILPKTDRGDNISSCMHAITLSAPDCCFLKWLYCTKLALRLLSGEWLHFHGRQPCQFCFCFLLETKGSKFIAYRVDLFSEGDKGAWKHTKSHRIVLLGAIANNIISCPLSN